MQHTAPAPLALTIPDACRRLALSRSKLYELMKQGELRSFKVGSRTLIPDADLVNFVAKRLEASA